jgi:hypothetical protein
MQMGHLFLSGEKPFGEKKMPFIHWIVSVFLIFFLNQSLLASAQGDLIRRSAERDRDSASLSVDVQDGYLKTVAVFEENIAHVLETFPSVARVTDLGVEKEQRTLRTNRALEKKGTRFLLVRFQDRNLLPDALFSFSTTQVDCSKASGLCSNQFSANLEGPVHFYTQLLETRSVDSLKGSFEITFVLKPKVNSVLDSKTEIEMNFNLLSSSYLNFVERLFLTERVQSVDVEDAMKIRFHLWADRVVRDLEKFSKTEKN